MEDEKSTKKKTREKTLRIETPVIIANGFGIATAKNLIMLTFVFTPPEDDNTVSILYRVGMLTETAEELSKSLNEYIEKFKKETKPAEETKQPVEEAKK